MPSEKPRILLTGATGQLGSELLRTLTPLGEILGPSRGEFDLHDTASIQIFLRSNRPNWIVNAAAYTAVDKAEAEQPLAFAINADAVRTIGLEARAIDATVLHFSTDYVFDGRSQHPYVETDATNPINIYGASKRAGERALLETGATALILRTSWVFGATGHNFLRTILKLARERTTLNIVDDQHGAPTWSRDLARLSAHMLSKPGLLPGIYHAAGAGETTWAGFANEALRQLAVREPAAKLATITPIPTSGYPTPAARPLNSRLSSEKLFRTFGYRTMHWQESLAQVITELT